MPDGKAERVYRALRTFDGPVGPVAATSFGGRFMRLYLLPSQRATEHGFTLLELIVVVLIMAILAAMAIPSFLDQRQLAFRAAVQADLRNVAMQAQSFATANGTYDGFESDDLFTGFKGTSGVNLIIDPADTTSLNVCVEGSHVSLPGAEVWSYRTDRTPKIAFTDC